MSVAGSIGARSPVAHMFGADIFTDTRTQRQIIDPAQATGIGKRVKGIGGLDNVIGNPLETTIFISHMIFEGVLERFPGLKICCAHGGGYLPSYADRMDYNCFSSPDRCQGLNLKKVPTEYLKRLYVDSLVFTPEALRHLAAVMGPSHIMLGSDYPFRWLLADKSLGPVDHGFCHSRSLGR